MKPLRIEKEIWGFLGRIQYFSKVYSSTHHDMWTNLPTAQKGGPNSVEWTMPRSLWEDQELSDKATNTCPTSSWKAIVVVSYHYEYNNGGFLAQYLEETRKENAIYYISKKMLPYEEKYSPLKKTCVALVWVTRKLRHYMLAYKVLLIARWEDS